MSGNAGILAGVGLGFMLAGALISANRSIEAQRPMAALSDHAAKLEREHVHGFACLRQPHFLLCSEKAAPAEQGAPMTAPAVTPPPIDKDEL